MGSCIGQLSTATTLEIRSGAWRDRVRAVFAPLRLSINQFRYLCVFDAGWCKLTWNDLLATRSSIRVSL